MKILVIAWRLVVDPVVAGAGAVVAGAVEVADSLWWEG
jgi:hypothetical protein